jgi:hypothetical protein
MCYFFILFTGSKVTNTSYSRLYKDIMQEYNKNILPIKNPNDTVIVKIDLSLIKLINYVLIHQNILVKEYNCLFKSQ